MAGSAAAAHQHWQVEALRQQLDPLLPGIGIEVLASCESTNTTLLARLRGETAAVGEGRRSHELPPCLLVAEQQSQGRGRLGRSWLSSGAGGSLTFSLGLLLDMADWSGLSLAVGCAIAEALEPLAPDQAPRLQLKWPNDLWLMDGNSGRKLGGILIETVSAGTRRMAVIGVGLNIKARAAADQALPEQFGSGYAALDELRPDLDAPAVLARIAPALAALLGGFPREGFAPWVAAYRRRDLTLGRAVTAGTLDGVSRGVGPGGELLIATAHGVQALGAGEISLRLAGG